MREKELWDATARFVLCDVAKLVTQQARIGFAAAPQKHHVTQGKPEHLGSRQANLCGGLRQFGIGRQRDLFDSTNSDSFGVSDSNVPRQLS